MNGVVNNNQLEMVEIKDFDADSYELGFDDDTTPEERTFFVESYPNVNSVAERKLHCTACNVHIGSAPSTENIIRMHPILRVTHCKKCHSFYNSGEFSKGEDGSELYCRWCGQGGEVYCCADCPYVFCRKCITTNLSKSVINDIMNNDNWKCFGCMPKPLWPLRAQHWAHINLIEKMKRKILSEHSDDDEIFNFMNKDQSVCCKKKSSKNKEKRKRKRQNSGSDSSCASSIPEPKRATSNEPASRLSALLTANPKKNDKQKAINRSSAGNSGIVCTPDILSFLNEQTEDGAGQSKVVKDKKENEKRDKLRKTTKPPSHTINAAQNSVTVGSATRTVPLSQPPPLLIRQFSPPATVLNNTTHQVVTNGRRITTHVRPPASSSSNTPVYHTINGFRIDLNSASQQETYRLPNGKLIQVKKQPTIINQSAQSQQNNQQLQQQQNNQSFQQIQNNQPRNIAPSNIAPRPPTFTTIRYNVQPVVSQSNPSPLHLQHLQQQQQLLNGIRPNTTTLTSIPVSVSSAIPANITAPPLLSTSSQQPTNVTQTAPTTIRGALSAVRLPMTIYPNTPLGQARTKLESQIHHGQEVCHHIIGKLNTLMVSNAYKSAQNFTDVKGLQIHLSYLLTYAIGRFKNLQDKCMDDMQRLGVAAEAANIRADKKRNYKEADDDLEIVEPQQTLIELDSDEENDGTNIRSSGSSNRSTLSALLQEMPPPVDTIMDMTDESDDELEIPMPPELDPLPNINIKSDAKLNSVAQVCLPKIENIFPHIKEKLQEYLRAGQSTSVSGCEKIFEKTSRQNKISKKVNNSAVIVEKEKIVIETNDNDNRKNLEMDKIAKINDVSSENKAPSDSKNDENKEANTSKTSQCADNKIITDPSDNTKDTNPSENIQSNKSENNESTNNVNEKTTETGNNDATSSNFEQLSPNNNIGDLGEPYELENISSPDNFEDLSKNGIDDPIAAEAALNELFATF